MNNHENVAESAASMERLRKMMAWPEMAHKLPILERRLFALESQMDYWDTFDTVGEALFTVWRGARSAPPKLQNIDVIEAALSSAGDEWF